MEDLKFCEKLMNLCNVDLEGMKMTVDSIETIKYVCLRKLMADRRYELIRRLEELGVTGMNPFLLVKDLRPNDREIERWIEAKIDYKHGQGKKAYWELRRERRRSLADWMKRELVEFDG